MKGLLVIAISSLFFISCTKDIDFDYQLKEKLLVVDCMFTSEQPLEAYISTNSFILDTTITYIDNALVILEENGLFVDTLKHISNGLYRSLYYPHKGNCYALKVEAPGFNPICAEDTIPEIEAQINNVKFESQVTIMEDVRFDLLSLDIVDGSMSTGYYELILLNQAITNNKHPYVDLFYISNPLLSIKNWEPPFMKTILFSDKMFNNGVFHLDIYLHNNGNSPIVKLRKTSFQYSEFKKSLYLHLSNQFSEKDDIDDFFRGEPENIYSNIENGYGVFAGYSEVITN